MKKYIEKDLLFFDNSAFFDTKIKSQIKRLANVESFQELIRWSSKQCYIKPKEIIYIGNKGYTEFFLFSIFRHKEVIEILWNTVGDKFDKGYRERLINNREQFASYLWELFLNYFFVKNSLDIQHGKKNEGPDIKIKYGDKIIWVECIAPQCGNTNQKVPPFQFDMALKLPIEEIKTRLKDALIIKTKKYEGYVNDSKIVNIDDKKYIAISTNNLSQYGSLIDINEPLLITICREMNFFKKNSMINGLIYSHTSIFDYSDKVEIVVINNDYTMKRKFVHLF